MDNNIETFTAIKTNGTKVFAKMGNKLSEEQVLKIIIDPTIERVWGFDFAPSELNEVGTYESEVKVEVGHDSTVYPDRVLLCYNNKKVVIEAKATNERLSDWVGQLETSVNASGASVGILWNGIELWLFLRGSNGVMETEPYKKINLLDLSEDDIKFIVTIFDPKHTINDAQMKRDQKVKREQEEATAKKTAFANGLCALFENPSDDILNSLIRPVEGLKSVQKGTTDKYRQDILPFAQNVLKERLVSKEISKYIAEQAKTNKLEPEEAAIATCARGFLNTKNRNASFTDDGDACRSRVINAENGRTILYIIGRIDDDGYHFTGIAFPNRKRGIGPILPISDFIDIQTIYGEKLVGIYDHINDSDWETFYDATFGE